MHVNGCRPVPLLAYGLSGHNSGGIFRLVNRSGLHLSRFAKRELQAYSSPSMLFGAKLSHTLNKKSNSVTLRDLSGSLRGCLLGLTSSKLFKENQKIPREGFLK